MELETVDTIDLKVLGPPSNLSNNYFENLFGFEWELTKTSWSTPIQTCWQCWCWNRS
jgi:catalase (peroxidase I)